MKTTLTIAAVCCLGMLCCQPVGQERGNRRGFTRPEPADTLDAPLQKSIYVSAVDAADSLRYVCLFRDFEEVLRLPAGPGSEISPDTDLHHISEGNLYTEYVSLTETVIKKNGKDFLRYEGREILRGLLASGEDLYTLGQNRSGEGFALRRNGNILFSSEVGRVWGDLLDVTTAPTGALYRDGALLTFCYYTTGADGSERKWNVVQDGSRAEVAVPSGVTEIYDLKMIGGQLCMVVRKGFTSAPVLLVDDEEYDLHDAAVQVGKDFRLARVENDVAFYGTLYDPRKKEYQTGLWRRDGLEQTFSGKNNLIFEEEGYLAGIGFDGEGQVTLSSPWAGRMKLEGVFRYPTCRQGCFEDGRFLFAGTPRNSGASPMVWNDGVTTAMAPGLILTGISLDY